MIDKFSQWLSVAGAELLGLISAGLGAAVAIFLAQRSEEDQAKKFTPRGVLLTWIAGTATAKYAGPLVVMLTHMPESTRDGVIFLVGLGGLAAADSILKQLPKITEAIRIKFLGG